MESSFSSSSNPPVSDLNYLNDYNDNSKPSPKKRRISSELNSSPEVVIIETGSVKRRKRNFGPKSQKMINTSQLSLVVLKGLKCSFCKFWATVPDLVDDHVAQSHPEQSKKYFVLKSLKSKKQKSKSNNINSNNNNSKVDRREQNLDLNCLKKLYKSEYWRSKPETKRNKFKCHRCIRSFGTRTDLHNHTKETKSLRNLFFCQICGERFESRFDLVHHLGHDHHPDQLRCRLCGQPNEYCVDNHTDYIFNVKDKNYDCPVCEKQFSKLSSLKKHMAGY